jgi:hypothetical protein
VEKVENGEFCMLCVRCKHGLCGVFMPAGGRDGGSGGVASCVQYAYGWVGFRGVAQKEVRSMELETPRCDWFVGQMPDQGRCR